MTKNNTYINTATIKSISGKHNPIISTDDKTYTVDGRYSAEEIAKKAIEAQNEGRVIDLSI